MICCRLFYPNYLSNQIILPISLFSSPSHPCETLTRFRFPCPQNASADNDEGFVPANINVPLAQASTETRTIEITHSPHTADYLCSVFFCSSGQIVSLKQLPKCCDINSNSALAELLEVNRSLLRFTSNTRTQAWLRIARLTYCSHIDRTWTAVRMSHDVFLSC